MIKTIKHSLIFAVLLLSTLTLGSCTQTTTPDLDPKPEYQTPAEALTKFTEWYKPGTTEEITIYLKCDLTKKDDFDQSELTRFIHNLNTVVNPEPEVGFLNLHIAAISPCKLESFIACPCLKTLYIENNITYIGSTAIMQQNNLETIVIKNAEFIDVNAIVQCSDKLTSISLPASLKVFCSPISDNQKVNITFEDNKEWDGYDDTNNMTNKKDKPFKFPEDYKSDSYNRFVKRLPKAEQDEFDKRILAEALKEVAIEDTTKEENVKLLSTGGLYPEIKYSGVSVTWTTNDSELTITKMDINNNKVPIPVVTGTNGATGIITATLKKNEITTSKTFEVTI